MFSRPFSKCLLVWTWSYRFFWENYWASGAAVIRQAAVESWSVRFSCLHHGYILQQDGVDSFYVNFLEPRDVKLPVDWLFNKQKRFFFVGINLVELFGNCNSPEDGVEGPSKSSTPESLAPLKGKLRRSSKTALISFILWKSQAVTWPYPTICPPCPGTKP